MTTTRFITNAVCGRRARLAGAALAVGILAAGCGSATRPAAAPARHPVSLPLATSLGAGQATWAVVPMGTAGPNLFWQLFLLPTAAGRWKLATPPDVATNGAIALGTAPAPSPAQSATAKPTAASGKPTTSAKPTAGGQAAPSGPPLVTGIHPSLLLAFSPITSTPDGGQNWSAGTPDRGLANVPDALGTAPGTTRLIALDRDGDARQASSGHAPWTTLTSTSALAAAPAARSCRLTALTAVAFDPAGSPVLAGTCAQAGVAGIFADQGGSWHAVGPSVPAALRGQRIQVLRLVRTGSRLTALLQADAGRSASVLTAWSSNGSWSLSPALPLTSSPVLSSSFGSGGAAAVELAGGRGMYLTGPGASWQSLPALPPGRSVTLALPAGGVDALAADGGELTAYRLQASGTGQDASHSGPASWVKVQQIKVPIQYGSSS
jgi:hypothetical protein